MRLKFVCCLLLAPYLGAVDLDLLDEHIQRAIDCYGLASLSLTIVKDGSTLHRGYGYSELETQAPVTDNLLYAIGSLSKGFTSYLLQLYNETSILSLEEPVAEQMHKANHTFNISSRSGEHDASYNLLDLLSHRTGLYHYMGFEFLGGRDRAVLCDKIQFSQDLPYRNSFMYNNWLYVTAARVGEVMAGKRYETEIQDNIFKKLGMKAGFTNDRHFLKKNAHRIAKPYFYQDGKNSLVDSKVWKIVDAFAPAGGIMASGKDMAKWMQFLLNEGRTASGHQLVKPSTVKALFANQNRQFYYKRQFDWNSSVKGYGEGWMLMDIEGQPEYSHSGDYFNVHRSKISLFPRQKLGIYYAFSGGSSDMSAHKIFDMLDPVLIDLANATKGGVGGAKYKGFVRDIEVSGCPVDTDNAVTAKSPRRKFGSDQTYYATIKHSPSHFHVSYKNLIQPVYGEEYLGTFEHPFLGTAEILNSPEDGRARFILSKTWTARIYERYPPEGDLLEVICFFDNVPWLPNNVEDGSHNEMRVKLDKLPHSPLQAVEIVYWITNEVRNVVFTRLPE